MFSYYISFLFSSCFVFFFFLFFTNFFNFFFSFNFLEIFFKQFNTNQIIVETPQLKFKPKINVIIFRIPQKIIQFSAYNNKIGKSTISNMHKHLNKDTSVFVLILISTSFILSTILYNISNENVR